MALDAWFQCIAGCEGRHELSRVIYRCPNCNDLLEVQHDIEALRERGAKEWMALFDQRFMHSQWPFGSGVWGKKEWVCPTVDNEDIVSMFEGGTNLFWAERFGQQLGLDDLWVKQCGTSHTGSFKDLGMTVLVSVVKHMQRLGVPLQAVVCASTGDTSAALAAYCASAGIPSVVLLPRGKVSVAQLVQPLSNGALVLSLETDFDGCMAIVQKLAEDPTIYLANSMNSLRVEGQKTVSIEITQQFEWQVPDFVVIPGGNLGNVSALGKGFQMMLDLGVIQRLPRLVVAQAQKANPLYESYRRGFESFEAKRAEPTLASAIQIGNPVSVRKAIKVLQACDGIVEQTSEAELAEASARADRTGLYCCPHTGVALGALVKLVDRGVIEKGHRVVVVSTAHGLKFTDFKVRYHEDRLEGISPQSRNVPVELPPELGQVRDAITRHFEGGGS